MDQTKTIHHACYLDDDFCPDCFICGTEYDELQKTDGESGWGRCNEACEKEIPSDDSTTGKPGRPGNPGRPGQPGEG